MVIKSIRQLARDSGGRLCVLLSVHQSNARLLALFDDLLVLGRGSMDYFGAPAQAVPFFADLGFPAPRQMTRTDFIVHLVDQRFQSPQSSRHTHRRHECIPEISLQGHGVWVGPVAAVAAWHV